MRKLAEFTLIALLTLPPLASADPVPAARRIDWTYTGVLGGIPNRTTICATFSPGATGAQISSAVSSCSNGVVFLNAGTYNLSDQIVMNTSNVTLRGAGANQTILVGGPVIQSGSGNFTNLGTTITAGGTKGTNTITVSSTASLSVGTVIEVDRADDTNLVVNTGHQGGGTRNLVQANAITAINGNVLTVRNPWVYDFTSSASAKIKDYWSSMHANVGFENFKIEHNGANGTVSINYCDSCWVKGVESSHSSGYHFFHTATLNMEYRDNFIHDGGTGPNNSGINFYGDYIYGVNSSARVENNIFNRNYPAIEINGSTNGIFVGYNYVYGSNGNGAGVNWSIDDGHAAFNIMNLYEGNIAEMFGVDGYWGGAGYGTALRNYFTGYNPNFNAYDEPIWLLRLAYDYNLVGNVLGSTLQGPIAYTGCSIYSGAHPGIYRLGYPNAGNCGTGPWDGFTPAGGYPDPKVAATLLRWGNYDYFNRATQFVASEIPAGVPVPSDQVIPKSYYYTSTPAWWKAGIAWPPIGPDVTGGNGDTSGHVNKIPAQVCWETSNLLGGGAFNASACYPATTSPTITSALSASGSVGTPFSYTITATNNPTSFNAAGLPAGLSVNTATGVISGTPTAAGTSSVALSATNAKGTGTATLALAINQPSTVLLGSQAVQSTVDTDVLGSAEAFQATATASGTVNVLSIYLDTSSTVTTLVVGLYADSGGHPGALISQGISSQLTAGAGNNIQIPGAAVTSGTAYWIAILGTGNGTLSFRDGSGCESENSLETNLTALPSTWSSGAVYPSCPLSGNGGT